MMTFHSPALSVLAQGLPIARTLDTVAAMATHLGTGCRCAILLPDGLGFTIAAERDLRAEDRVMLSETAALSDIGQMISHGAERGASVLPLLTQSTELVGLVVLFEVALDSLDEQERLQLSEICSVATLSIEQRNLSEELSYRAHHDPLTHLWNRSRMEEQICRALTQASARGDLTGLILIGIDWFRQFNELLGRQVGDQLLGQIGDRLTEALEAGLLLARSGGDEFTILMPGLKSENRVYAMAAQLRSWFDSPFQVGDHELIVQASFGTAVAMAGECDMNELQNRADQALRFAKDGARGRTCAFSREMAKTTPERLLMERHLRLALQRREFEVYYQPQVQLLTGRLLGVEALLRWKHPSLGFISPMTFVPMAEELGIIGEIGEWVLGEAVRQLEAWYETGLRDIRMAVNVSACQFAQTDFVDIIAKRLNSAAIKPKQLELEITETALMTNFKHGAEQLARLRSLGVQIALDDFGTGHSSLAYLQRLPIDRLKIDRMFVKDIACSDERPPLLASIIQMGLAIGCSVIAEGVETVEQALAISRMNCEEAQGFLYSKPVPPAELLKWAESNSVDRELVNQSAAKDAVNLPLIMSEL